MLAVAEGEFSHSFRVRGDKGPYPFIIIFTRLEGKGVLRVSGKGGNPGYHERGTPMGPGVITKGRSFFRLRGRGFSGWMIQGPCSSSDYGSHKEWGREKGSASPW